MNRRERDGAQKVPLESSNIWVPGEGSAVAGWGRRE